MVGRFEYYTSIIYILQIYGMECALKTELKNPYVTILTIRMLVKFEDFVKQLWIRPISSTFDSSLDFPW